MLSRRKTFLCAVLKIIAINNNIIVFRYKAQIERMEMDIKALRSANERVEALNEKLGGQTSARERVRTEEK